MNRCRMRGIMSIFAFLFIPILWISCILITRKYISIKEIYGDWKEHKASNRPWGMFDGDSF